MLSLKNLVSAALVAFAVFSTTPASAQYIYNMYTARYGDSKDVTYGLFWAAYGIAVSIYGYAPPPKGVTISHDGYLARNLEGFYDIPNEWIFLNRMALERAAAQLKDRWLYVLVHEMGHHIMVYNKVPLSEQHCRMYTTLDFKVLDVLGVPKENQASYMDLDAAERACKDKDE